MVEQALRARLTELRATEEARLERLEGARKKEKQRRRMQAAQSGLLSGHRAGANGAKRLKTGAAGGDGKSMDDGSDVDAQFLPDDVGGEEARAGDGDGDGPRLSKEVRELMAR